MQEVKENFANPSERQARIRALLLGAGSHFASVEFVKKDGTIRTMLVQPATGPVRLAAAPQASEEGKAAAKIRAANNPHLLNIWDHAKAAWRSVNLDTVRRVQVNKIRYLFD